MRMCALFQQILERPNNGISNYGRDLSMNYHKNKMAEAAKESDSEEEDVSTFREKKKKTKRKKKTVLTANLSGTRYDIIRLAAEKYGFSLAKEDDFQNCFLIWSDNFVSTERVSELKSFQRINHFPGMSEICRKDYLARNMAKMSKCHADEYNFVPRTWIMPQEQTQFQNYIKDLKKRNKKKTFIIKPSNGAMGNGIRLMKSSDPVPQADHMILQEYIDKPFLIDGYKCDLRIYVLVTSCDPLRVFLFNDGLLRMSTEKYVHPNDSNLDALFMHLTNYSVNKHSGKYLKCDDYSTGSKRSLRFLNEYLRCHHYDIQTLWKNIIELIIKTMVVAEPHLLHAYRMCRPGQTSGSSSVCFEILGFDILLDRKLRPWLLEVNRSPSFGTDEKIDREIKYQLLVDTLRLVNIKASDKRRELAEQKAQTQRRLLKGTSIPKLNYNGDIELMKRQKSVARRKESLQEHLQRIRRESARDEFENRNGGRFRRVFPPEDRLRHQKYAKLLMSSFATFMYSSNSHIHKEIEYTYEKRLEEQDVMDMLAQCEAEENSLGHENMAGHRSARQATADVDAHEKPPRSAPAGVARPSHRRGDEGRAGRGAMTGRRRLQAILLPRAEAAAAAEDGADDDDPTERALRMLMEVAIKFPGKSEEEAEIVLSELMDHWLIHKQSIANYWLVKLDSAKRRKVVDIVHTNVRTILQRAFCVSDVEHLRLYRIFNRVLNRLLWSNGQGLWECFSSNGSWETIFCKSTEQISATELACCRRIVRLCKDCLLIVYQYAVDTATMQDSKRVLPFSDRGLDSNISVTHCRLLSSSVPDFNYFDRSRSFEVS